MSVKFKTALIVLIIEILFYVCATESLTSKPKPAELNALSPEKTEISSESQNFTLSSFLQIFNSLKIHFVFSHKSEYALFEPLNLNFPRSFQIQSSSNFNGTASAQYRYLSVVDVTKFSDPTRLLIFSQLNDTAQVQSQPAPFEYFVKMSLISKLSIEHDFLLFLVMAENLVHFRQHQLKDEYWACRFPTNTLNVVVAPSGENNNNNFEMAPMRGYLKIQSIFIIDTYLVNQTTQIRFIKMAIDLQNRFNSECTIQKLKEKIHKSRSAGALYRGELYFPVYEPFVWSTILSLIPGVGKNKEEVERLKKLTSSDIVESRQEALATVQISFLLTEGSNMTFIFISRDYDEDQREEDKGKLCGMIWNSGYLYEQPLEVNSSSSKVRRPFHFFDTVVKSSDSTFYLMMLSDASFEKDRRQVSLKTVKSPFTSGVWLLLLLLIGVYFLVQTLDAEILGRRKKPSKANNFYSHLFLQICGPLFFQILKRPIRTQSLYFSGFWIMGCFLISQLYLCELRTGRLSYFSVKVGIRLQDLVDRGFHFKGLDPYTDAEWSKVGQALESLSAREKTSPGNHSDLDDKTKSNNTSPTKIHNDEFSKRLARSNSMILTILDRWLSSMSHFEEDNDIGPQEKRVHVVPSYLKQDVQTVLPRTLKKQILVLEQDFWLTFHFWAFSSPNLDFIQTRVHAISESGFENYWQGVLLTVRLLQHQFPHRQFYKAMCKKDQDESHHSRLPGFDNPLNKSGFSIFILGIIVAGSALLWELLYAYILNRCLDWWSKNKAKRSRVQKQSQKQSHSNLKAASKSVDPSDLKIVQVTPENGVTVTVTASLLTKVDQECKEIEKLDISLNS